MNLLPSRSTHASCPYLFATTRLNVSETQRLVVPHQDIHALCLELVSGKGMLARELLRKVLSRFADALQGYSLVAEERHECHFNQLHV